jgi:hypothetical protein
MNLSKWITPALALPSFLISSRSRRAALHAGTGGGLVFCVLTFVVLFGGWDRHNKVAEELSFELQNESFCRLSWTIAEFKLSFAKQYGDLLLQVEQVRQANRNSQSALDNAQVVQVLEDVLAQARTALPLESMEQYLLRFYRVSGLTNKYIELFSTVQQRNVGHFLSETDNRIEASQPAPLANEDR